MDRVEEHSGTYLSCACMEHTNVLVWHDVNSIRVDVSDFDEIRLECKDPGVRECKALWLTFPVDSPVRSCTPTIPIDKEREIGVVEEKFAVETLDVDWSNILLSRNKVQ